MTALRIIVPFGGGETPQSFTSRLAAANGLSAREFCLDFEVHFQKVVDGDATAIATVADLGGVSPNELAAHAFVRSEKNKRDYVHRGQHLIRSALCRSRVRVCPRCLLDDIGAHPRLAPAVAGYGRGTWMIEAIKTCPDHHIALAEISNDFTPNSMHDFVAHTTPALARLDGLAVTAPRREPSGLERYVLDRLGGRPGTPFLDGLELHAAIRLCEVIGAVAEFGRTANLKKLSDDDWWRAGAAGHAIAVGGEPAICAFLDDLQRSYTYTGAGNEGAQALYGRFFQFLEFGGGAERAAYDPVRAVVGRHIRQRLPVGPGDVVFGEPVTERKLHSVHSLAVETGLHPKRLGKLVQALGLVEAGSEARSTNSMLLDARAGLLAASRIRGAMPLKAAGAYVNAPRVHIRLLAEHGFIRPCVPAKAFTAEDFYAPADLDAFLDHLMGGAVAIRTPKPGQATIPAAAKRACCSAADIVRLILDRRLEWTGRLAGERGYLAVMVAVDEIKTKTRGQDHGGLTLRQAAPLLGCSDNVVRALIDAGHLRTRTVVNPMNKCPQIVVMPAEVERFRSEYVSLFALAKERGEHFRAVKKEVEAAGVVPAFDPEEIEATFYRRRMLS